MVLRRDGALLAAGTPLVVVLLLARAAPLASAERFFELVSPNDIIDVTPLFLAPGTGEVEKLYDTGSKVLRCCCDGNQCRFADIKADKKSCGLVANSEGCACMVGSEFGSFTRKKVSCLMTAGLAAEGIYGDRTEIGIGKVMGAVREAERTRWSGNWKGIYRDCSNSCGVGTRTRAQTECADQCQGSDLQALPQVLPCADYSGCRWNCDIATCGWGRVSCVDKDGAPSDGCGVRVQREKGFPAQLAFPSERAFGFNQCFRKCTDRSEALTSMCAVTTNHLDEQYNKMLHTLVDRTCLSELKTKPHMIVVMSQELNHRGKVGTGADNFALYIHDNALPGYTLAAPCQAPLSAQSAIFLRTDMAAHMWPHDIWCSQALLRSSCDWTNCKGSSVLRVFTSAGTLVVVSWHGARAGTLSEERVVQFEEAIATIHQQTTPFQGHRHVVFGGDTNVRSTFSGDGGSPVPNWMQKKDLSGKDVFDHTTDILGITGWTVDQHLSGEVGINPQVKAWLAEEPLLQAKDWFKLCPTYRKIDSERNEKLNVYNLRCRTASEQMANNAPSVEYLAVDTLTGEKSRAPSWTERIFLSKELYDGCGVAMKDTHNPQNDHDPMFVRCTGIPLP